MGTPLRARRSLPSSHDHIQDVGSVLPRENWAEVRRVRAYGGCRLIIDQPPEPEFMTAHGTWRSVIREIQSNACLYPSTGRFTHSRSYAD